MVRLIQALIMVFIMISFFSVAEPAENLKSSFTIDWCSKTIEINGRAPIIPGKTDDFISWQYNALISARKLFFEDFIRCVGALRIDALNYGRNLLIENYKNNSALNDYLDLHQAPHIIYHDSSVELVQKFNLFGTDGIIPLLVSAGLDRGNFHQYAGWVYSTQFSGLVIDARGLGRKVSIAPRIFDEDHNLIYGIDLIDEESFSKWGLVQWVNDPTYKKFMYRVGKNPYRIVAIQDKRLIETDIAISRHDAQILLRNPITRKNLIKGNVIIVIDSDLKETQFLTKTGDK